MQTVRISEIGLYLRCPRLVYFDALGSLPRFSSAMHIFTRELMLMDPSCGDLGDLQTLLQDRLDQLQRELPLVYGEELSPDAMVDAAEKLEGQISQICQCLSLVQKEGAWESDVDLRSDRLGLSGRLDRLVQGTIPSIIRLGCPPDSGVWKRDRLALAGYALLLEEKAGGKVKTGRTEYPIYGEVRAVEIRPIDRMRVLRLRDRIRQIKDGTLPDMPKEGSCDGCAAKDHCHSRRSLASKFF